MVSLKKEKPMSDLRNTNGGKIAAAALAGAVIGSVFLMLHHPTVGSPGHDTIASEIIAERRINMIVHGGMIIFVMIYYFALSALTKQLGDAKPAVRGAQTLFGAATIAMVGAALVSGFVVPGLAEHFLDGNREELLRVQLRTLGETNQALAAFGSVCYGAAIFLWSLQLLGLKGLARITGMVGIPAGLVTSIGVATDHLELGVHGMTLVVVIMGVWFLLIAALLTRGKS